MNETISVIIPSYNSSLTLAGTIRSVIEQQDHQARILEIIVVDSSPDELALQELEQFQTVPAEYSADKPMVRVKGIRMLERTAPGIARNRGAAEAQGDVLVFLDSDVFLLPDWMKIMMESYQRGRLVAGGSVVVPDFQRGRATAVAQYYLQLNEFMPSGNEIKKDFLPSCNMLCDRKIFEEVGGFPRLRAAEDVVFGLNVNRITDIWFIPGAQIGHVFRESVPALIKNQMMLGRFNIIYRKSNFDSRIYRGVVPLMLLPLFLVIKLRRMLGRVRKGGPVHVRQLIMASHLFSLGIMAWAAGFAFGCLEKDSTRERQ